jgi:hypothetical protein
MKRESKGQRVKTFKAWIPNSDLTKTETQVVVYFKADNGLFYIFDGAHMFDAARETAKKSIDARGISVHSNMLTDNTLDGIVRGFGAICASYEQEMREALKKKVIRFTFKRNTKWDGEHKPADDISFCGTPAIHFTYEILYQVGKQVYYKSDDKDDAVLQYRGSADEARFRGGDAITVDWTEEREAFFANMQASLVALIHRVDDFQKNLLVNVDKAIAASTPLMLEKPKTKGR